MVVDISILNVSLNVGGSFITAGETHALRNGSLLRVAQFELAKVGFLQRETGDCKKDIGM